MSFIILVERGIILSEKVTLFPKKKNNKYMIAFLLVTWFYHLLKTINNAT